MVALWNRADHYIFILSHGRRQAWARGEVPPPGNVQMGICNPSPEFLTVFVVGLSRISGVVPTYLRMKNVHDS